MGRTKLGIQFHGFSCSSGLFFDRELRLRHWAVWADGHSCAQLAEGSIARRPCRNLYPIHQINVFLQIKLGKGCLSRLTSSKIKTLPKRVNLCEKEHLEMYVWPLNKMCWTYQNLLLLRGRKTFNLIREPAEKLESKTANSDGALLLQPRMEQQQLQWTLTENC